MTKVFFNSRDELISIDLEKIAVIQANGNYSRVVYISKREIMLSKGISKLEEIFHSHLNKKQHFIRLGRSFIINHYYLQKIDLLKQLVILSDNERNEIRITIPKSVLKIYKNSITKSFKIKENDNNNYRKEWKSTL